MVWGGGSLNAGGKGARGTGVRKNKPSIFSQPVQFSGRVRSPRCDASGVTLPSHGRCWDGSWRWLLGSSPSSHSGRSWERRSSRSPVQRQWDVPAPCPLRARAVPAPAAPQPRWSTAPYPQRSGLPLLQHSSPCPSPLPAAQTRALPTRPLRCAGHGAREPLPPAPKASSRARPGTAWRESSRALTHTPGLSRNGSPGRGEGSFSPSWGRGGWGLLWLVCGSRLSQGRVPAQPQLQRLSKCMFTEGACPCVSAVQRRSSEASSGPPPTAPL